MLDMQVIVIARTTGTVAGVAPVCPRRTTHTAPSASSASYPQRNGKWVSAKVRRRCAAGD